jgi:hypothetical protein
MIFMSVSPDRIRSLCNRPLINTRLSCGNPLRITHLYYLIYSALFSHLYLTLPEHLPKLETHITPTNALFIFY